MSKQREIQILQGRQVLKAGLSWESRLSSLDRHLHQCRPDPRCPPSCLTRYLGHHTPLTQRHPLT